MPNFMLAEVVPQVKWLP